MKLNKIYKIIVLLLFFTSLISCKKFLEQEPYNRLSNNEIFKDVEGARTTLIGCYDNLKNAGYYLRNFGLYADLTGGNIKYGRLTSQPFLFNYNFTNTNLQTENDMYDFYKVAYNTIYRANNVIQYVNQITDATDLQKNRFLAEAYCFRAMVHFDLVKVFALPYNFTADASHAGIIYRTKNTDGTILIGAPLSVKQVYAQLYNDIDSAILLYTNSAPIYASGADKSYLSFDAAQALKMRISLYRDDWATATAAANTLFRTVGKYPLISNANYKESWRRKATTSKMEDETIFYLTSQTEVNQASNGDNYNTTNATFGLMAASNDLLTLYTPTDIRGQSRMFVLKTANSLSNYYTLKYQGQNDSADNYKVLRISEVYLSRAEAYAERDSSTQALADLNLIRSRAGIPIITFTSKQALLDSIFVERRRELCFEGHLLFDIARKKKNLVRVDCSSSNCSFNYPNSLFAVPRPEL